MEITFLQFLIRLLTIYKPVTSGTRYLRVLYTYLSDNLMAIVEMASTNFQKIPDFGHALVEFKNMRFLIMDRPSKANLAHFVQVCGAFFKLIVVKCVIVGYHNEI